MVERWARFLTHYDDPAELERLALEDPMMAVARQTLEELSRDPEARRKEGREQGWHDGMAKGWHDGMAALLLHQLTKRFGPLSPSVVARVETATPERLDVWAERVITEPTLDDVLAP